MYHGSSLWVWVVQTSEVSVGVCGGGVAADGVGWRVTEEPLSESEWGERPL